MLKQRVIIAVVAVVLIVVLYNLPRIVVDNDPGAKLGDQQKAAVTTEDERNPDEAGDVHAFEISTSDQEKLSGLKEKFSASTEDEKLSVADSIVNIYLEYNKYDSAARYLDFMVGYDPSIENYQRAADAYYESFSFAMDREKAANQGEKARQYYQRILDEEPDRFDIRNKIAMTYITSANPMQGITMLRQILEEDPDNENAIYNLGTLAIQSGQFDRARDYFEQLVEMNPKNMQAQFYLGLSYFQLNDKDKARKQFELVKSMEDDPAVLSTVEGYLQELN